jgi:CDP-diacylglycerol--glycerol-3-phosphate 3-phosphatidyltransferase
VNVGTVGVIVLLLLFATMPIFALRHRTPDPDVARRPSTYLLGPWVRQWLVWVLAPAERLLVRTGVSPDALNALGFLGGGLGGLACARGDLTLAAWLVAVGGLCDILDGRVARARGSASASGAFLDSTLDRFAETATLLGVGWHLRASDALTLWTLVALSGSMLVSYTRARGEALGAGGVGGLMQRPERITLLVLGLAADAPLSARMGWAPSAVLGAAIMLIGAGAMGTAIYRAVVIVRQLRGRERAK